MLVAELTVLVSHCAVFCYVLAALTCSLTQPHSVYDALSLSLWYASLHSHTLTITCTCCDDEIKGIQDQDLFTCSVSDSLSGIDSHTHTCLWSGALEVLHGSCTVEHCSLVSTSKKGAAVRIAHMGAIPTTLRMCDISRCEGMGVHCRKQGLVWLVGCLLQKLSKAAVCVEGSGEVAIMASLLQHNHSTGVMVQDHGSVRMFACDIIGSGHDGILLKGSSQLVARGCSMRDSKGVGLCVQRAEKVILDDCSISGSTGWGAEFIGTSSPQLHGCVVNNSDGGGLMIGRDVHGGSFIKCDILQNSGAGAVIEARVVVRQCAFHDNSGAGAVVRAGCKPSFIECEMARNRGPGLEVRGAGSAPVVECCVFSHGKHSGVLFTDRSSGQLSHCDIHQNNQSGVSIQNLSNPELLACNIHDGRNAGVAIFDEGRGRLVSCTSVNNTPSGISISTKGNPVIMGCEIADAATPAVFGVFVYDGGLGQVKDCRLVGIESRALLIGPVNSAGVKNDTIALNNEFVEAHAWTPPVMEDHAMMSFGSLAALHLRSEVTTRPERKGSLYGC